MDPAEREQLEQIIHGLESLNERLLTQRCELEAQVEEANGRVMLLAGFGFAWWLLYHLGGLRWLGITADPFASAMVWLFAFWAVNTWWGSGGRVRVLGEVRADAIESSELARAVVLLLFAAAALAVTRIFFATYSSTP